MSTAVLGLVVALMLGSALSACAGVRSADGDAAAIDAPSSDASPRTRSVPRGKVRLVVSTGFGAEVARDVLVQHEAGMSVMSVLAGQADVETAYGGGFVDAIDGVESTFGVAGEPSDWFYWVDGVMAQVGAPDFRLRGGETVWWDHHRWQGSSFIPVVLQAFPAPWQGVPLTLVADACADAAAAWAADQDLEIAGSSTPAEKPAGSALVVALASEVTAGSWLDELVSRGPEAGVFVSAEDGTLSALDHLGDARAGLSAAAVGAPHPDDAEGRLLLLLAVDEAAMGDLLDALATLSGDHVGFGLRGGDIVRLPDEDAGED